MFIFFTVINIAARGKSNQPNRTIACVMHHLVSETLFQTGLVEQKSFLGLAHVCFLIFWGGFFGISKVASSVNM